MDVHRPKAARSIREFLIEIGTIICGILIALGLEQALQFFHHRAGEVEARAAIEGEMGRNIGYLRLRARKQDACTAMRLGELEARLHSYLVGGPWRPPGWVGRTTAWTMEDTRWQAITKGGLAAMLSAREIERYSYAQSRIGIIQTEENIEQADWAELRAMESLPRLDLQLAARFEVVLRDTAYRVWRVSLLTKQLEAEAARIGLPVLDTDRPQANTTCYPIDTTREEAVRMTKAAGYPYGEP